MKSIIFISTICNALFSYSIAFVHLGSTIPDYLPYAMKQAHLFNPDSSIYLVCNEIALLRSPDPFVTYVTCESLAQTHNHRRFLASSKLDKRHLNGFWLYASERFFCLEELMTHYNLTEVFHLESDVMLYENLAVLLPKFQKLYPNQIAATFDCDTRCVPGFMYISSSLPLSMLTNFMTLHAHYGKNDMQILQAFRNSYHRYINHLPIIPPQYTTEFGLQNQMGAKPNLPGLYSNYFDAFQGIFDAAAIGQYVGGISPRNGSSPPGYINETCYFNPSYCQFSWEQDDCGRWKPYIASSTWKYPIFNLHIHSKKLNQFYSVR